MQLQLGDNGKEVIELQQKLSVVLKTNIKADGDFGNYTKAAIIIFQKANGLFADGVAGPLTLAKLNEVFALQIKSSVNPRLKSLLHLGKKRFVVFVDAGHGGIDSKGNYVTSGKRGFHQGKELHYQGNYYEGLENRIIAEDFIEALTDLGVMAVRLYHPWKDTSLDDRAEIVLSYLERGYYGYLHSFHSNAIDEVKNSKEKLEATIGFMVFSTKGDNLSDTIADIHYRNVNEVFQGKRFMRSDKSDGDFDFEENFAILRKTDIPKYKDCFASLLEEWGFHTSGKDCEFMVDPENRNKRVRAAVDTALETRTILNSMILFTENIRKLS